MIILFKVAAIAAEPNSFFNRFSRLKRLKAGYFIYEI